MSNNVQTIIKRLESRIHQKINHFNKITIKVKMAQKQSKRLPKKAINLSKLKQINKKNFQTFSNPSRNNNFFNHLNK
jgi:hypothetical protein